MNVSVGATDALALEVGPELASGTSVVDVVTVDAVGTAMSVLTLVEEETATDAAWVEEDVAAEVVTTLLADDDDGAGALPDPEPETVKSMHDS